MEAAGWNSWDNFRAFVKPHFCTWKATCRTFARHSWKLAIALPFGLVAAFLFYLRRNK